MQNRERRDAGLVYDSSDPQLVAEQVTLLELVHDFNALRPSQGAERVALLRRLFGALGDDCWIEPPFRANWGGRNAFVGDRFYANFGLTLVDDGEIRIGDDVMLGPGVTITTAGHPVLAELRRTGAQFNLPVTIGNDVWIGSGVQIMPGVTIGDAAVVGAGSIVTRDVPPNVVAVGTPCRVVREIGEHDRRFFWRDRAFDLPVEELVALLGG